jgi:hypothetical protein
MNSNFWKIIEKQKNIKKTKENSKCSGEDFFKIYIIWLVKIQILSNIAKGAHMAGTLGAWGLIF